jgi:hypothetical protein
MHTVAALLVATVALGQWNFRLDTAFRTSITMRNVNSMAFLSTGEILLSGIVRFLEDEITVPERYLALIDLDGDRVPSFPHGHGGHRITPWADRFYVSTGLVRRLDPEGLLDPTFIHMNSGPYFSNHFNGDYHAYPDGRILMTGQHFLSDSTRGFIGRHNLIWFSNEGYLDTTRIHRKGNHCWVGHIQELPPGPYQGGFICTSTCTTFEDHAVDWIFRTDSLGIPDTTFRTGVFIGDARTFLPLPDGRVYAGGNFRRSAAPNDTLGLARFMPDGSLDPAFTIPQFASGEGLTAPFGPYVYRVMPWAEGGLLVTGDFKYVNGEPRHGLCMIDSTGQLLPAFAGNWMGNFVDGSITSSTIVDVLPNADTSAIYICGQYVGYGDGEITDPTQRFVSRLLVEKDSPTQVQEAPPSKPPALRLHPNPASHWVAMNYHLPGYNGEVTLVVRDAGGRVLHQLKAAGEQGQRVWDTRELAPGVYVVELQGMGRVPHSARLVVQP